MRLQYRIFFLSNNIDVDPNIICHAEQSEASIFNAILRSNAFGDVANARCEIKTSFISLTQSQHSRSFRMTSSQKNKSRVNCYIITFFYTYNDAEAGNKWGIVLLAPVLVIKISIPCIAYLVKLL